MGYEITTTPQIPIDVLLDIVERLDVAAVVRCAATSKAFRGTILGPAFRRLLAQRALGGGLDPALLLGVSFHRSYVNAPVHRQHSAVLITTPSNPSNCVRLGLFGSFQPTASRDGLLVLRRDAIDQATGEAPAVELCVRDTLTGRDAVLPSVAVLDAYPVALLTVGRSSFELLVVDERLRFNTFSSSDGRWGHLRQATQHTHYTERRPAWARSPVVIGRTVYYSCWSTSQISPCSCWERILALDTSTAVATVVDLPQRCFSGMMTSKNHGYVLLASVQGRLRLLVAESFRISMWTPPLELDSGAAWTRQTVINKSEIQRQTLLDSSVYGPVALRGLGERSGAIILQLRSAKGTIIRLDLGTKEPLAVVLEKQGNTSLEHSYLHEIDMSSLLQAMKSF
ncbi:hypothetical protein BRADI_5g13330v3 [Brachypodium distachyon]|uniref:F-box domain-containing protein n=1 Tax=Brachypodium distachyon TaxID=15368 RepID=A0A2K2CGZ0_BRADI|nr:hypothetical protein BRADI_5g13330v3 [Brachypodium distachyon]